MYAPEVSPTESDMEILCFFAGMVFVYTKSMLPCFFLLTALLFRPRFMFLISFLGAIVWGGCHQKWIADQGMPNQLVIQQARLSGFIASIPTSSVNKTQFQFYIDTLDAKPVQANILMSCYNDCPSLQVGQYWHVKAKLHKARNLSNPGGFDYVNWLNARHMQWTGSAQRGTFKLKSNSAHRYPLLALRQRMASRLEQLDSDEKTLGILQALALGITTHIDKTEWELFRRTGTTHLMVISGAHIGLIAGLGFWIAKWLWCRIGRVCLRIPAPKAASILAIFMALGYALLAGFAVPAQRSLYSCFFMLLRNFFNQRFSAWQAWRYALFIVLISEPHAVLMPGFYLSFMAVAILIMINQRTRLTGVRNTLSMQLACLFGLMPLTLYWFSYGAVNGLVANVIAIPWVGFVIVPLAVLTTIVGQWFTISWLVTVLRYSILLLLHYLQWVDSFAWFNVTATYTQIVSPLALILAMSLLLLIPVRRFLPVVVVLVNVGLFPRYEKVKLGEVRVDVLDVGQGLSVVVQTTNHRLVYDTGIQFYQGTDMGKLVIIPYLNTLGIHELDKVVISHPDLDHRGGLKSLEEKLTIHELLVDDPSFYKRGLSCHQYHDWVWDGVLFHFFAISNSLKSKNNTSCVLQIKNKVGQVLLTGDIEKLAENYLVTTYGQQLKSTVIIIPHHGSKTSSTLPFLKQVSPRYAIVSYGFDNRYHFPHQASIRAYQQSQIPIYNTVDCGMVSVVLGQQAKTLKPTCYRVN